MAKEASVTERSNEALLWETLAAIAPGTELRDALTAAGRPPEWVSYPGEFHGFYKWEHQQDHWRRIEAFLARHLAPKS